MHTLESLKAFEKKVADSFNSAEIRAPIHLHGGNEEALLRIFNKIEKKIGFFRHGGVIITVY